MTKRCEQNWKNTEKKSRKNYFFWGGAGNESIPWLSVAMSHYNSFLDPLGVAL
jgi:hypothetical protein